MTLDRRQVLLSAGAAMALHPAIARALAIDADKRTGTIGDVQHVVILMQENRAFDHYFGTLNGVRGFGDRFPIPVAGGRTVWTQSADLAFRDPALKAMGPKEPGPAWVGPFPLNTARDFRLMRVEGTPHNWFDAQEAWDEGRMGHWPAAKGAHAMGYYEAADIPFQFALADAFTVCDAYHCAMHTGTNSNRLFLWSGTNDPSGRHGGPSLSNSHDRFVDQGGHPDSYTWTTYVERLLAAGISWRIYQDEADNFTDNPTEGFKTFRDSRAKTPGSDPRLYDLAFATRRLDGLKADVLAGKLPQVSYIVAPAADSEHPGPSSPAQGADYTARVLEALTADAKVWARTALFVMFDENDGFFDHVPPPAPPSRGPGGAVLGGSTVDTAGEYHLVSTASEDKVERPQYMGRPYGLGPRVPMYVISPWSRGGWVSSEVFDHTSVIRFLEQRFGVMEPNISAWRRAVCGDLTACFDFRTPNANFPAAELPLTTARAWKAAALPGRTVPSTPQTVEPPVQAMGPRLSRALPYALQAQAERNGGVLRLSLSNTGKAAAVFHVYDRLRLAAAPRRYTVGPGLKLEDAWPAGAYDLWILGPGGFHRHLKGDAGRVGAPLTQEGYGPGRTLILTVANPSSAPLRLSVTPGAYERALKPWTAELAPGARARRRWPLAATHGWYDLQVTADGYLYRLAGRIETGAPSISDPAMGGPAIMNPSAA